MHDLAIGGGAAIAPGLQFADDYAIGVLFVGLAVMVAIVTLTHQRARAFSAATVYLGLGLLAAAGTSLMDAPLAGHDRRRRHRPAPRASWR